MVNNSLPSECFEKIKNLKYKHFGIFTSRYEYKIIFFRVYLDDERVEQNETKKKQANKMDGRRKAETEKSVCKV